MNDLSLGWTLMGYGLVGVFVTLALLMLAIRTIVKIFPERKESDMPEQISK